MKDSCFFCVSGPFRTPDSGVINKVLSRTIEDVSSSDYLSQKYADFFSFSTNRLSVNTTFTFTLYNMIHFVNDE